MCPVPLKQSLISLRGANNYTQCRNFDFNRELLSRPGDLEEKRTEKRSQRLSKILKVERKLFSPSLRGERASFINTFYKVVVFKNLCLSRLIESTSSIVSALEF